MAQRTVQSDPFPGPPLPVTVSNVPLPVSGIVSGTINTVPPAHASTNVDQIGGAAISLGPADAAHSVPVTLANDVILSISISQIGEALLKLGQQTKDQALPVTLAIDERKIPVIITDGNDTVGTITNPIKTDPTGLTTQPVLVNNVVPVSQSGNWANSILSSLTNPVYVQAIDQSALTQLGDILREIRLQNTSMLNTMSIQSGQFVPIAQSLPFLST